MKVSLNWLRQFTDIDLSVDELVSKIGTQLGAVEHVTDLGAQYKGIIIAKVISCEQHPNADKLSVCWIDDGGKASGVARNEQGHVQVVCGAPNVRAGLTVAWLPPGSTVPSTFTKEPFVLGARELRGIVSNGMLASAAELAIGDDHSGIVEIDIDADPGTDFADLYELNDYIIDIENKMFTHRPDCFGILGVAREIAGIQHKAFVSPDWYKKALDRIKPGGTKLELTVKNEISQLVPRFMAVAMDNASVKQSPLIIQTYLSRVGLRPINAVVDVTNYLMVLTGQPTHAYDYDKLPGKSLETRLSRKGDKIRLLSGKELELEDDSTILITSADVPVGIGGIMGGADTEVSGETTKIVIECANFDMYSIRRTSMKYGLFTDAVTRFNKGQSYLQNDVVLEEAVATMQYISGAHVASDVIDNQSPGLPASHQPVTVSAEFINIRLGGQLATEDMARLLENVECRVEAHGDTLTVYPPFWRTDLQIAEDIVEEVGRLYGLDNLPVELPARKVSATPLNPLFTLKREIRALLSKAGANEVLTYSFVHGKLLEKAGQDSEKAFKLSNAISPELQYYRMSLLPSLLDKVHQNIKAGFGEFGMFEIGQSHIKGMMAADEPSVPDEFQRVAFVITRAKDRTDHAAYYHARLYAANLLDGLYVKYALVPGTEYRPESDEAKAAWAPFDPERSASIQALDGTQIGIVGEFKASVRKALKLPDLTAGFEIDIKNMQAAIDKGKRYRPVPRYPKVQQDISFKVDPSLRYATLFDFVQHNFEAPESTTYEFTPLDIYQKAKNKHITLRLTIASYIKTLKAEEVNALLDSVAAKAQEQLGAERL